MTQVPNKKRELTIETENMTEYKAISQSYHCSPKSQLELSRVKDPNIIELFDKKQLNLETKFKEKTKMFENMLNQHLVSPRTFNMKVISLENTYQKERKKIEEKLS